MATLKLGSKGQEVEALQQALIQKGFSPGAVDGDFGPGTQPALIASQKSAGLLADGIAGPRTLAALGLAAPDDAATAVPGVTIAVVAQMFPVTPLDNIKTNLPPVLDALVAAQLQDKPMVLMA